MSAHSSQVFWSLYDELTENILWNYETRNGFKPGVSFAPSYPGKHSQKLLAFQCLTFCKFYSMSYKSAAQVISGYQLTAIKKTIDILNIN